jgi:hypothetical protein
MEPAKNVALAPTRIRNKLSNQFKNARWTNEENEELMRLISDTPTPDWTDLAAAFPGKTPLQLAERWEKVLDPSIVKGSWTREEDEAIVRFVEENGTKDWTKLAMSLPGRIGKQCRERWRNHLDPDVNRAPWTDAEDEILISMVEKIGSKWVKLAEFLPGRSDNAIKNRWNSTLKKKLEWERNGGQRPKRGRPPQKAKPHSADEVPRPPRFDELAPEIATPLQMSGAAVTPHLLSPFSGLRSPLSLISPGIVKDMAGFGWSPGKGEIAGYSPQFPFSPSSSSLSETRAEFLSLLSPLLAKT